MFSYIQDYFNLKLYTADDIKIFVKVAWITIDEFKTITGVDYVA